jgi:hypothetical protein
MAHSCPQCGCQCHCGGDIDDCCFEGTPEEAACTCCAGGDDDDDDHFDDYEDFEGVAYE